MIKSIYNRSSPGDTTTKSGSFEEKENYSLEKNELLNIAYPKVSNNEWYLNLSCPNYGMKDVICHNAHIYLVLEMCADRQIPKGSLY